MGVQELIRVAAEEFDMYVCVYVYRALAKDTRKMKDYGCWTNCYFIMSRMNFGEMDMKEKGNKWEKERVECRRRIDRMNTMCKCIRT